MIIAIVVFFILVIGGVVAWYFFFLQPSTPAVEEFSEPAQTNQQPTQRERTPDPSPARTTPQTISYTDVLDHKDEIVTIRGTVVGDFQFDDGTYSVKFCENAEDENCPPVRVYFGLLPDGSAPEYVNYIGKTIEVRGRILQLDDTFWGTAVSRDEQVTVVGE